MIRDYAAHTVQWLGQRLVSLVVGVFALMGFCLVPLGEHTALGHVVALGRTGAAQRFAAGLVTGTRAAVAELEGATRARGEPSPPRPPEPRPAEPARREPSAPRRATPANASFAPVASDAEPLLCLLPAGPVVTPSMAAANAGALVGSSPVAAASAARPDG